MLLIPYRFSLPLLSVPFVTLLVCLICLGTYGAQFANERSFLRNAERFCDRNQSNLERMMYANATGERAADACLSFVLGATLAQDRGEFVARIAEHARPLSGLSASQSRERIAGFLTDEFRHFSATVPKLKTREWWYQPKTWNPVTMVTSVFAHGDWLHVFGNLFFFFAFAAAVETILGSIAYAMVILLLAFGTNIAYSVFTSHAADPLPTVGLSGVVMGMMGLLTYLMPSGKIRCFYWIIFRLGVIEIPAWVLFLGYAGFDAYQLVTHAELGQINLVAHVSGAVIGYILGLAFFRRHKRELL